MAEAAIGGLFVRIGADYSDLVSGFEKADKAVVKFSKAVNKHAQEWVKFGAAVGVGSAAVFAFAKHASDTVDQLGKMSQKVGVTVESLSALKYAAGLSDVSLDQLGTGLKQLSKFMVENGQAGQSVEERLLQIADEFSKSADGAGKTAAAMKMLGKAGADLIPWLNQGRAGIQELRNEAKRLGLEFSTQAAKDAGEFNDNLKRLQGTAEGLAINLAGPLVKALGDASKAMLEARKSGEGFFRTLLEGWRALLTGDDAHKWNVEMAEAGDNLIKAQNNLDAAYREHRERPSAWTKLAVKDAQDAVASVKAEINRLMAIKPIIAPDAPAASGADKPQMGEVPDKEAIRKAEEEREWRGKMLQEGMDEEARVLAEIDALYVAAHDKRIADEKEFQAQRLSVIFAGIDAEQEAAIQAGAEQIEIDRQVSEKKIAQQQKEKSARETFMSNLTGLMNTGSKKLFEIGKKAAIAQAAYKGGLAVMDAWEAGMSVGGPWAPVLAAAYATAAALNAGNLIANISSQQFGGGGGTPVAPTQGSSGVSPVGAGGGQAQRGPDTIVNVRGDDVFSGKTLARLAEKFNEFSRDGGRIVVNQT